METFLKNNLVLGKKLVFTNEILFSDMIVSYEPDYLYNFGKRYRIECNNITYLFDEFDKFYNKFKELKEENCLFLKSW